MSIGAKITVYRGAVGAGRDLRGHGVQPLHSSSLQQAAQLSTQEALRCLQRRRTCGLPGQLSAAPPPL